MSSRSEIQSEKLFRYNPLYGTSIVDTFIGAPSSRDRASQKIIILLELRRSRKEYRHFIDELLSYSVEAFESASHATPELVLESILESLNIKLPELAVKLGGTVFDDLNLLIAITEHGQIHFSQLGDVLALLVQNNTLNVVSEAKESFNANKPFAHITSGLINPGDTIILTTHALTDYIADDKLAQLASRYPPVEAVRRLELLLEPVPRHVSFASVFIKFTTELDELVVRESMREVPAPQIQGERLADEVDMGTDEQPTYRDIRPPHRVREEGGMLLVQLTKLIRFTVNRGWYFLYLLGVMVWYGVKGIAAFCRQLITISHRHKQEERYTSRLHSFLVRTRDVLASLNRVPRYTLYGIILITLLVLHVLIVQAQKREAQRTLTTYDKTLALVSEKSSAAENALIYNDERGAEQFLLEIKHLLRGLTPSSTHQQQQIASYLEENDRKLNKVRHINYVADPLLYADTTTLAQTPITSMAYIGTSLVVTSGNTIYSIEQNQTKKIAELTGTIILTVGTDSTLYALTETQQLYRITNSTSEAVTMSQHPENTTVTALDMYGGNIYILDQNQRTIYKYTGTGDSFRAGTVWRRDDSVLARATDIAIDGYVYALTSDANIIKLLKGELIDFRYHTLRPQLGPRAKLYTHRDSNYLFFLDPDNNRIVIMNKDGSIQDQYTSPRFDNLIDLAVNPTEGTVAILNTSQVYLLAVKK